MQAMHFRRCRLIRNTKTLFQRELPEGRQASVVLDVERKPTATESLQVFFQTISGMEGGQAPKPHAVTIAGVGLRIEGRSSVFDMWYFTGTESLYAIDSADRTLIFKA